MAAVSEAPAKLPGATNHDKLVALATLTYSQQAIWYFFSLHYLFILKNKMLLII